MERLLEDIAQKALLDSTWYALLDAVCKDRTISLADLLRAKNTGSLDSLKHSLNDPLLSDAINVFRSATNPKRAIRVGLDQLLEYAPTGSRLSYLGDARTITDMCHRAEKGGKNEGGRKRNSVRRYLLRAISLLLRYHWGNAERNRVFSDVQFGAVDDTREIHLSPVEIARLLQACDDIGYHELAVIIRIALQTSADRGVLLSGNHEGKLKRGLLSRDVTILCDNETGVYEGEIYLEDGKTEHRSRTVPLTDSLCRELLVLLKDKKPDDPVFTITYQSLDQIWKRAKEKAGLADLRFKDLRAQISIYGEEAGVPLTVLSRTMGHDDERMTRRYQKRAAVLSVAQAEEIERAMLEDGTRKAKKRA